LSKPAVIISLGPLEKKTLSTFWLIFKLRRFLRDTKVDILHARSRLPAWIAYFAWRSLPKSDRPKFITTVHGHYSVKRYSQIMTCGERVIVVSNQTKAYALNNYPISECNIRVIHRGIDRQQYPYGYHASSAWLADWYATFPHTQHKLLLVLPGRLTRLKGQLDFIQLIARLRHSLPSIHGLIVGEASEDKQDYLAELHHTATELNVSDHLTFTGHRNDLKDIMSISEVVLSLSYQAESFGRTTLEALSIGKPVVGYAHGGVEEQLQRILPEGLVELGDIESAAQRIKDWLNRLPSVPATHPFTLDRMLSKTLDVYMEVINETNPL
jgi:glycosyltransferase involved in cell wall biosynthesis